MARSAERWSRSAVAARGYAAIGWRAYPARRGGKAPLYSGWLLDATTDPDLIRQWWSKDEGAPNIGVVAGESFDVVDVEAAHVAAFRTAARAGGIPETPMARSGGGGLHIYIAPMHRGTRRLVLDGVHIGEWKGSGGVLVPPSVTGWRYAWIRHPRDVAVAEAPPWLRTLVAEPPSSEPRATRPLSPSLAIALAHGLYRVVAQADAGERNSLLFWASRRAAHHRLEREAVSDILLTAALQAGLTEREARATIASGLGR